MARIVTLGEIMLRLKSPALERFFQSPMLEATFGGGEANVAVSLANYGMDAAFVTALPNNAIGEACLRDVRSFGVDVSGIKMVDGRMGIYFLAVSYTHLDVYKRQFVRCVEFPVIHLLCDFN